MRITVEEQKSEEEEEPILDIHGDLLEITLSFIPLIDLIAASCVSKSWQTAVTSSLTNLRKVKPWFLIHTQMKRTPESGPTYAFDPRSNLWLEITESVPIIHPSTVRSSTSDVLYSLASSTLSFSDDPLHLTWRHCRGLNFHRIDPIVARVGSLIVVAGSAWEFDGDPLAVEVYDLADSSSSSWRTCHSMPMMLKDSASATWVSVATTESEMFVTEKASGITYAFNPRPIGGGLWRGPFDFRPDPRVFSIAIGSAGGDDERLVVAGLIGKPVEGLGIWRVGVKDDERMRLELICYAPREAVETLTGGGGFDHRSIEVAAAEGIVYLYDPARAETVVWCEYGRSSERGGGWDCVWGSTGNVAWGDGSKMVGRRMVFTCGKVEMADLKAAMRDGNRKFQVVN